jgi:hypothetical protein
VHWDPSVSVGTLVSLFTMLGAMLWGLSRVSNAHARESATQTAALNNLAALTEGLQKAVQVQNGRLAKVETKLEVQEGVQRALAALGHPPQA